MFQLRVSNRSRFVLITATALILLAWFVIRAGIQRNAINAIHRRGGYALYAYEVRGWDVVSAPRPRGTDSVFNDLFATVSMVSLAKTDVGDDDLRILRPLQSIVELDLSETNITDEGLAHLMALPSLRFLVVEGTGVSEAGIAGLKKSLPECDVVGFDKIKGVRTEWHQLKP